VSTASRCTWGSTYGGVSQAPPPSITSLPRPDRRRRGSADDPAVVDVEVDGRELAGLLVSDPDVADQQIDHDPRSGRAMRQQISYPSVAAANDVISAWS
jgi:hypothetical protein